jgi:hypothetical protein
MFVCPYLDTGRGNYEGPCYWMDMTGRCASCTKPIAGSEGVFCANFSSRRGNWKACQMGWCGECYSMPQSSPFPIRTPEDDEGFDQTLGGEEKRFIVGRNGDHLMCPYQCDLCHFRNIQKREPLFGNRKDRLLLQCIRRASLDAFWAQEPSTV